MQELGSGNTDERPVRVGGALVTLVDPHRGSEVEYNRWYERDHALAGCMIGAWTVGMDRFVATADLKKLRYPAPSSVASGADSGTYIAIYWILDGYLDEWIDWAKQQVMWLHDNGRMFPHRDHVHTMMYRLETQYEQDDGVPIELALAHRSPHLVVVIGEIAEGQDASDIEQWFIEHQPPSIVGAEFRPHEIPGEPAPGVRADSNDNRFCQLWFAGDEVPEQWDAEWSTLGERFAASGLGELVYVAPFRSTTPGTDLHTDRLWNE